jgi:hypothetical protein
MRPGSRSFKAAVCLVRIDLSAMKARLSQTNTREPKPTETGKLLSCEFLSPTVSLYPVYGLLRLRRPK